MEGAFSLLCYSAPWDLFNLIKSPSLLNIHVSERLSEPWWRRVLWLLGARTKSAISTSAKGRRCLWTAGSAGRRTRPHHHQRDYGGASQQFQGPRQQRPDLDSPHQNHHKDIETTWTLDATFNCEAVQTVVTSTVYPYTQLCRQKADRIIKDPLLKLFCLLLTGRRSSRSCTSCIPQAIRLLNSSLRHFTHTLYCCHTRTVHTQSTALVPPAHLLFSSRWTDY